MFGYSLAIRLQDDKRKRRKRIILGGYAWILKQLILQLCQAEQPV
jgi:hypothetical protein